MYDILVEEMQVGNVGKGDRWATWGNENLVRYNHNDISIVYMTSVKRLSAGTGPGVEFVVGSSSTSPVGRGA